MKFRSRRESSKKVSRQVVTNRLNVIFLSAVTFEDGRPAENQGSVRGAGEPRRPVREPELATEGVRHPEIELHEVEEAPSAVQATKNHVRATRHRPKTLRAL